MPEVTAIHMILNPSVSGWIRAFDYSLLVGNVFKVGILNVVELPLCLFLVHGRLRFMLRLKKWSQKLQYRSQYLRENINQNYPENETQHNTFYAFFECGL